MVSVLMCTYNRRFCLKQAIDSVLCQTYPDFEFVIVDDRIDRRNRRTD